MKYIQYIIILTAIVFTSCVADKDEDALKLLMNKDYVPSDTTGGGGGSTTGNIISTPEYVYYPFDSDCNDKSDNVTKINGTAYSIDYTAGKFGLAAVLKSSSYISAYWTNGSYDTKISFSMWYNPTNVLRKNVLFSKFSSSYGDYELYIRNGKLFFKIGSSSSYCIEGSTLNTIVKTGQWQHIGVVVDLSKTTNADRIKIYYNGVLQTLTWPSTSSITYIPNSSNSVNIGYVPSGYAYGDSSYYGYGKLDELRVYSTAISSTDIQKLYKAVLSSSDLQVLTLKVYAKMMYSAKCRAQVIYTGKSYTISAKGFVWSTTSNPTISSYSGIYTTTGDTGVFEGDLTNLYRNYTYYVRSYITTSTGYTYYGNEITFSTPFTDTDYSLYTNVSESQRIPVLMEYFNSNSLGWETSTTSPIESVASGYYNLDHSDAATPPWTKINIAKLGFDPTLDFEIRADIKCLSSYSTSTSMVGLFFGSYSNSVFNWRCLFVYGNQSKYEVAKYNGSILTVSDKITNINYTSSSTNFYTLVIRKVGTNIYYYLVGTYYTTPVLVYTITTDTVTSLDTYIGFFFQQIVASVDNIYVYKLEL
jgi:hypothetical protein